jgi:hypothetical protein
MGNHKA